MKLTCQKHKFSLDENAVYLNCAYMSPLLKAAEAAGIAAMERARNPFTVKSEDFFSNAERLRAAFARLLNAPHPTQIAIIPSVSYGIASAAKNIALEKGDEVVIVDEQFPSNYYCWERACKGNHAEMKVVAAPEGVEDRGKQWNRHILESIGSRTKVVAMAHVHWADGTKFDLAAIRKRTREVDALLIVDGTQSVGALPFDVRQFQPDALVCGGYKWLLGPYGYGLAWFSEQFNDGAPLEENWINRKNSDDFAGLVQYQETYREGAMRYNVGEHSNFILLPMLLQAIEQLNAWGVKNIQEYAAGLTAPVINNLKEKGFHIEDPQFRGAHLIGIRLPDNSNMDGIKQQLARHHIHVSVRGSAIRVSTHLFNTQEDLNLLAEVLSQYQYSTAVG